MEIKLIKKTTNNRYKIVFDNEEIILYEDILIKYNLLSQKNLTKDFIFKLEQENNKYVNYYLALKYLKTRIRSKREIENYLTKYGVDSEIASTINKLEQKGYINDSNYAKSFVYDKLNLTNDGPNKIRKLLEKENIDDNIIRDVLTSFTKDLIKDKIIRYVTFHKRINRKSKMLFDNKMMINLINLGYDINDIKEILSSINIDDKTNYEKEYNKEYTRLSKKYSGYELEQKMKQKMYQKGYYNIKEE